MRRPHGVAWRWWPSGRDFPVAGLRSVAALLVTAVLLLSVGPNPFNTVPVRGDDVVYDFVANASSASWSSGGGGLPFPGSDSDSRGFALIRTGFPMEDGSTPSKSLETHPQWVGNGWIQGRYPATTVPDHAELHLKVGFYNGATGTDGVVFQVQFEEGQTRSTLLGIGATYDGKLDVATKDLSSLAGKTGHFILYANAGNSSGQDWAAWAEARVVAEESDLPDLRVKRIETGPGGKLQVTVRNYGDAALPQGWSSAASVSFDAKPKGVFDLRAPTSISDGGIEEPGGSSVYLLPWDITGAVTVEVCADSADSIAEEDEDNNCRSEKLEPATGAGPDLVVAGILCDWDNHRIGYVLKNVGAAETPPGHVTGLIVESSLAASQSETEGLAPGAAREGWFEEYSWDACEALKVIVCADNRDDVEESDEDNNCLASTCECGSQPPPSVCPAECECLKKDEGYARGLEFCLDENGAPIVCDVIDAEKEVYRYCFSAGAAAAAKAGSTAPLPQDSDVDGDGDVGVDDVAAVAAHYGGRTGTSRVPWDPNEDGVVDFKDLAIVGARFGGSIAELTLEEHGIRTPGDLLEKVGSAAAFTDLSFRTGIDPERLLRQIGRAEIESVMPGLPDCHLDRLEALGIGSFAALQSVPVADESVLRMLCGEMRLDWIASGGKERGEPLPSQDDLEDWIGAAQGKTPAFGKTDDGAIRFPDGSVLPFDEEEEIGDAVMPAVSPGAVSAPAAPRSSLVFTGRYPGIGGGVLSEEAGPGVPRELVPEPCPVIDGRIYGFPYDVSTLKIQAERFEQRMTFDPLTRQPQGVRRVAVEGRLIDVEQRFAGLSGGRLTFYNSGCLGPGEWTLTPVFHSDEPGTPVWHGDWSPYYREVVVTSGLEPVTDADFTFLPVETEPPTIEITYSPVQPGGTDVITFNVSIEDDHMIQKVEVYEWGRYTDGRPTEPELLASYFWDSGFPRDRSYRFERGPYPVGEPNEVYFEVAAWDYPGNHAVAAERVRVRQIEMPGLVMLLGTALPSSPDVYYVASIGEIVFSKDSDGSPPEGEMHCSAHANMTRTDGGTREFVQDYPYYNYVEALCDDGYPMCQPWVPVLAVPEGELGGYGGYTLATGVYEGDGWLERFLRSLIDAFVGSIMVIIDAILCVIDVITASDDLTGCEDLVCDVLDIINVVGLGTGGEEDDYMGTAAFMTTRETGFGLEGGGSAADFYAYGAADSDEIDWAGALADGSDTEGFCGGRSSVELLPVLKQGVTTFADDDPGSSWIRVLNHVELYDTRPVGGVKVKFLGAHVYSDRDGFWRGDGDVYARTLVGAVGGSAVGANDHSLEGEDLAVLPYSAADVHKFECGDVSSGSSFEKNRFVFDRSFSGTGLALLYVQIGLWDDDGDSFAANEIGVLSQLWTLDEIVDMMEHPDEADARHGGPYENDHIEVTVVHPVVLHGGETGYEVGPPEDADDEFYYVISDTREVHTRQEYIDDYTRIHFHDGSLITYELWVNPNVMPTHSDEVQTAGHGPGGDSESGGGSAPNQSGGGSAPNQSGGGSTPDQSDGGSAPNP